MKTLLKMKIKIKVTTKAIEKVADPQSTAKALDGEVHAPWDP